MRQLQRFFKSPTTVCVSAEGHLLAAQEPGDVRPEWKPWRFDASPDRARTQSRPRLGEEPLRAVALGRRSTPSSGSCGGVQRVIIATDPGREGSMIAWEVLEHLGYKGHVDRLKLGALDETSIRRAFTAMAQEPASGERDYAAYLEALCRLRVIVHLSCQIAGSLSVLTSCKALKFFGRRAITSRTPICTVSVASARRHLPGRRGHDLLGRQHALADQPMN